MSLKQISVFLENKKGQLAEVSALLGGNNINLHALSIADTQDFGILRLIAENPEAVAAVIKDAGYICTLTDVIAVSVPHTPGSLAHIVQILSEGGVDIEYTYAFAAADDDRAYMVFRVSDNMTAAALLGGEGLKTLSEKDLFVK
ncbi:MAG: ACT domain-containing protein [Clostridia bacterium]|nr:ACT domain-containing protein [Clostridia bacterium]